MSMLQHVVPAVKEFFKLHPPIPKVVTMFSLDTSSMKAGESITIIGYDRSFLSTVLKRLFNMEPPTNTVRLKIKYVIGKTMVELEEVECLRNR